MDLKQECIATSMTVKIEGDRDDAFSSQVPGAIFPHLWNGFATDIDSLVKKEGDYPVKTEDESDEVMVKQELDIEPIVLQPKSSPCSIWSGTSASLHEADLSPHAGTSFEDDTIPALPYTSESCPLPRLNQQNECHRTEVEDEYCEEDGGILHHLRSILESNSTDGAYQRILTFYDSSDDEGALDGSQCRYCVKPLTECSCSTNLSMFEADTDEEVKENPFESKQHKASIDDMKDPMPSCTAQKPNTCNQYVREEVREKPFKCDWCKYSTSQLGDLVKHLSVHTGEDPYKCELCECSAFQLGDSEMHFCVHIGEKVFKCGHCAYRTSHQSILQRHMRIHTGVKPYKHFQCDHSPCLLGNLNRNRATCISEKTYKCEQCDYSVSELDNIRIHRRTHMGEKLINYACEQCEYNTSRLSNLKRHMRTHTDKRPYQCGECNYTTSHVNSVKRHMRSHMSENPYKCQHCTYSAALLDNLKTHVCTDT